MPPEDVVTEAPQAAPTTVLGLLYAGGLWNALILGLAFVLLILFVAALLTRSHRLALINLGVAFCPFLLGVVGTYALQLTSFADIARRPTATIQDVCAGLYVASFCQVIGLLVSVPAVIAALLLLARTLPAGEAASGEDAMERDDSV